MDLSEHVEILFSSLAGILESKENGTDQDNSFLKMANIPAENAFKEDPHQKTKIKKHLETSADSANRKEAKICLASLDVGNFF